MEIKKKLLHVLWNLLFHHPKMIKSIPKMLKSFFYFHQKTTHFEGKGFTRFKTAFYFYLNHDEIVYVIVIIQLAVLGN